MQSSVPAFQIDKPLDPQGGNCSSSSPIRKYFETLGKSSYVYSPSFFLYLLRELMFDYECLGYGLWETIDTPSPQRYETVQVLTDTEF